MLTLLLICSILVSGQFLFLLFNFSNYNFILKKRDRNKGDYQPAVLLTIPCKGIDQTFEDNISAFYKIDYSNFSINFVVEDKNDPAYQRLLEIKDQLQSDSKADKVEILIAGKAEKCGQKNHNLVHSVVQAGENVEILAFADSDAHPKPNWLNNLVFPLRNPKRYGASSGYRWFVPSKLNFASIALSVLNGKVAQMLGKTKFNQIWGGSMAIRRSVFDKLNVSELWLKSISDDYSLSYAVKKSDVGVAFASGCMVASHENTNWCNMWEFARRQFLITRVMMPRFWSFALFCAAFSVAGSWAALTTSVILACLGISAWYIPAITAAIFFASQIARALLRKKTITKLLPEEQEELNKVCKYDILLAPLWSVLMLLIIISSAIGRTIVWRGIKYKLTGATNTDIIK